MESLSRINEASGVPPFDSRRRLLGPAFAHTAVGMAIASLDGSIIEANSAFLDIVGRSFNDLARETVESITHPDDRAANAEGLRRLHSGDIPDFQIEKRYCRPDGSVVWVRNSLSLLRDAEGEPLYTIAISENIDDRRRVEDAMARAKQTLELATLAADVGIFDLNLLTDQLDWSPGCRNLFGFPGDMPVTIDDFRRAIHPEDRDGREDMMERVFDPEIRGLYDAEYRVVRPSGEVRWAAATGKAWFAPVPDGTPGQERAVRFIGTMRDITERHRSTDALIQAEKLAATGRLAASIAHEINNPLEAVTNLLYLLRECDDPHDRGTYLALAEGEIKRVSEICTQTLRFYRDPRGPALCRLSEIVESVLALFHGRLHLLNIRPETRFAGQGAIFGSQGELRQVFVNFISNALDAMPRGGRLVLRARPCTLPRPGTRVTVADTGEGMSPETLRRIFEPFFTTKQATGTGLGLWLSLEILNKHHAAVRVRSRSGRGTAISMFFPG